MTEEAVTREWDRAEHELLDRTPLIRVAAERPDGSLADFTTIGHVRLGSHEMIRSLRGADGRWYRGALRTRRGAIDVGGRRIRVVFLPSEAAAAAVDAAFRARYGNDAGVQRMTQAPARDSTLTVVPLLIADG